MTRLVIAISASLLALAAAALYRPTTTGAAPTDPDPHAVPAKHAREAMEKLALDDEAGFIAFVLRKQSHLTQPDQVTLLIKNLRSFAKEDGGKPNGTEFIEKQVVGESLVRFIWIEKRERTYLIWRLTYYRTQAGWYLHSLSVDREATLRANL